MADSFCFNLAFVHTNSSASDCILAYLKQQADAIGERRSPMFALTNTPWFDPEILQRVAMAIDDLTDELDRLKSDPGALERVVQDWFER